MNSNFGSIPKPVLAKGKSTWSEGRRLQREKRESQDPAGVKRRGGLASPAETH